jgi:O-antigen ligase
MKKLLTIENVFLFVIFATPTYLLRLDVLKVPTNIHELLMLFAIALFFLKNPNVPLPERTAMPKMFLLSLAAIILGASFSLLFSVNRLIGLGILKSWFLIPLLFAFILINFFKQESEIKKIIQAIYFSTIFIASISLVYKALGITTFDGRLQAFYLSPNYLAMYLAPGFILGIFFQFTFFKDKVNSKLFFLNLFFVSALAAALYFTYSYGAWLALLATFLLTTIFLTLPKKKFFFFLIVCLFLFIFFLQKDSAKFLGIINFNERSSVASRMMIWKASVLMLENHPIVGIGPGNFQNTYLALQPNFPPYLEWAVPEPHNLFLAFWLQGSLLGLSGFLLLLLSLAKIFYQQKSAAFTAPLAMFFIYLIFHGLVDTPFWKNDLAFVFWLFVFLALSLKTKR